MCLPEEEAKVERNSQLQMRRSLTKKQIIRRTSDIRRIFKEGKTVSTYGAKILYVENGMLFSRILVVPAKKFGNAVERNTVRRRIKEIFRNEQDCIAGGYDIACIVYPGNVYDFYDRKKQFLELTRKAGLRKR